MKKYLFITVPATFLILVGLADTFVMSDIQVINSFQKTNNQPVYIYADFVANTVSHFPGGGFLGDGGSITNLTLLVKSNYPAAFPTLHNGDNYYWSSNGVPHVIWVNQTGVVTTNRLVP